MAQAAKLLADMRHNPRADWRIEQFETVARAYNVNVRKPRGSHMIFEHPRVIEGLSVPARRPIKPIYVRRFVTFIDRVCAGG